MRQPRTSLLDVQHRTAAVRNHFSPSVLLGRAPSTYGHMLGTALPQSKLNSEFTITQDFALTIDSIVRRLAQFSHDFRP